MAITPSNELKPEDFLQFVETDEFVQQWAKLGFDCENDLLALQLLVMRNPDVGRVVEGTGGLRKMRFGRAHDRIGKRGGIRVCYVYFRDHAIVLLVTAYGKGDKGDLTTNEKKHIRDYVNRAKAGLDRQKRLKAKKDG